MHNKTKIVIVDDSPNRISTTWAMKATEEISSRESTFELDYIVSAQKQGRGKAVMAGFRQLYSDSSVSFFIQMDSDGSHTTTAINKILQHQEKNFVIGSRYLEDSAIIGWPLSRRVFSRLINLTIKRIFGLSLNDWTNGLRGYSRLSVKYLLHDEPRNTGFISLTEEVILLDKRGIIPYEVSTVFVNRVHGKSTVGVSEIVHSLRGIIQLMTKR